MKLGMRLHGGLPAATCVDLAKMAEDTGFQSLWFAENPFNRGIWPAMTACLLATKRITIGPGIFIAAAAIALVITIITISIQAIRGATANPTRSLNTKTS